MSQYQLRGTRVASMEKSEIEKIALNVARVFKLSKSRKKYLDQSFEFLSVFGVTLSVIDYDEWPGFTTGHFDPSTVTLSVPEAIYENACKGEREALFVMLHELGHLFLSHKALLHSSNKVATINEDSEWQADTFAEAILTLMGYTTTQISFDFYSKKALSNDRANSPL